MQVKNIMGERLTAVMVREKCTVTEFERKTHMPRGTLYRYLNGIRTMNSKILTRICSKMNVSADYLLGLKDTLTPVLFPTDPCESLTINDRVKELFYVNEQLSYGQFAIIAGVNRSSIYRYIVKNHSMNAQTIYNICKGFGCSADWLLGLSYKQ